MLKQASYEYAFILPQNNFLSMNFCSFDLSSTTIDINEYHSHPTCYVINKHDVASWVTCGSTCKLYYKSTCCTFSCSTCVFTMESYRARAKHAKRKFRIWYMRTMHVFEFLDNSPPAILMVSLMSFAMYCDCNISSNSVTTKFTQCCYPRPILGRIS